VYARDDIVELIFQRIRQVELVLHIDFGSAIYRIEPQNFKIVFHIVQRIDAAAKQMIGNAEDMSLLIFHLNEVFNRESRVRHVGVGM